MHTSDARQRANGVIIHAIRPALTMVGVGFVFSNRQRKIQWKAGPVQQQFRYDSDCQDLGMSEGRYDRFLHQQKEKRVLYCCAVKTIKLCG